MKNTTETKPSSQDAEITAGQALQGIALAIGAAVVTVAKCVGAFRLGFESASADIYERQVAKNEHEKAGLMALVGVVDQAKGRELLSCQASGRSDCMSVIAPVVP